MAKLDADAKRKAGNNLAFLSGMRGSEKPPAESEAPEFEDDEDEDAAEGATPPRRTKKPPKEKPPVRDAYSSGMRGREVRPGTE